MTRHINLSQTTRNQQYRVVGFANSQSDYATKLYKMGFIEGTDIELAPVTISDPLVVQIRGSRVALRKSEAQEILVEEV